MMAAQNGSSSSSSSTQAGERSPLLGNGGLIHADDDSTLKDGDEEVFDPDRANQQVGKGRGLLITLGLWGLIFLQAANMSGISTTQSKIAEDLDAFASANWFTSIYLIAMSSTSPLSARLAQIFSPRNLVLAASILFAIGGVITSLAPSLRYFLLGRAIQGLGGAGIMTISFILVLELAGKKRRGLYIGLVNTGFTIGVSFGAVLFGGLLPVTGWRFLFWIQSPFALAFGTGIYFSIPSSFTSGQKDDDLSTREKLVRIDYLGAITLSTTITLFLFGLSWQHVLWQPIVASLFTLVAFILVEVYVVPEPIIPISVLKSRGALLSCVAQLGIMAARWSVLFYTPVYAIAVRGWTPVSAGSILIPTNLGFAYGGIIVGGLHIKRAGSFWLPSIIAYGCFALTLALLSQITNENTPTIPYLLAVFVNGLSIGSALNYTLAHLLHLTPPETHFISTSLLTTFRGFAGSFGSAIGGGLFIRVLHAQLESGFDTHGGVKGREDLIRKLLGSPALVKSLKGLEKDVAVNAYVSGLKALFLAGVGLALVVVAVQAGTGWKNPGLAKITALEEGVSGQEDEELNI